MTNRKEREFNGYKFVTEVMTDPLDNKDYECMTISDFARATGRYVSQIHSFIREGIDGNKLKTIRVLGRPFIKYTELFNFVFRSNINIYYRYNEKGERILVNREVKQLNA